MDKPDQRSKEKTDIVVGMVAFLALMLTIAGVWYVRRSRSRTEVTEVSVVSPDAVRSSQRTVRSQPTRQPETPGTLMSFRGRNGESMLFRVTGATGHTIWGTDIYTDDSPLAVAAVHGGALQVGEQGVVRVTILPGRERYEGSARNSVTSASYEKWEGSYQLERVNGPTSEPVIVMAALPPSPAGPSPAGAMDTGLAPVPTTRRAVGDTYTIEVVGETNGTVWGTDIYTDDSSIAAAAVHAGLLAPGERGEIRVTVREGLDSYPGSRRNGITTRDYGSWGGSFSLERADGQVRPGL